MRTWNLVRVAIGVAVAATSGLAASRSAPPTPAHATFPSPLHAAPPSLTLMALPGSGGGTLRLDADSIVALPGSGGGTLKPLDVRSPSDPTAS